MSAQHFVFYTEGSIVCILIFLIMLVMDLSNPNRQERQVIFQRVMIVHILYFVNDIFWAGVFSKVLPYNRAVTVLLNYINFILLSAIALEWFLYAAANTDMKLRHSKKGMMLIRIPFIVMAILIVIAYFRDPLLWLSEEGVVNPAFNGVMVTSPLIYIAWASIYSLRQAAKKENAANRKLFILIGLYPLEVVFFGILQLFMDEAPLFCFGVTVMMVYFYIHNLRDQISIDPLTSLSNRGQLMKYVAAEDGHHPEGVYTYILMIDVNNFKKINDNHGHAEGDRALQLIAGALRKAGKSVNNHPFIGRYGGDEFIMILHTKDREEPVFLTRQIRRELDHTRSTQELPYELSVGIGYDEWSSGEDFQSCMIRADKKLYEDKNALKYRHAV